MTLPKKNRLILNANYESAIDECLLLVRDEIGSYVCDEMAYDICSSVRKQLMGDE
tara:strand:+ start:110 stop:274 length:165 start_codon:yes stop_codon:yes gene_type:complete